MTLPTFAPPVSPSSLTDKPEINIRRADFGDGYTQTTRNGLNHMRRVASIRWEVLTREQADEITAFLAARGGVEPFYYRVPGEDQPTKWTCEEWSETKLPAALASIDLTFRQSFDLRR